MRGKTGFPPQPSTRLAVQPGKTWADPARNDVRIDAAISAGLVRVRRECARLGRARSADTHAWI